VSGSREALLARRAELRERAASQRQELALEFDGVSRTFLGADRFLRVVDTLEGKVPQLAIGAALAALFVGPSTISRLTAGAYAVWQVIRGMRSGK
jgi:hypothetical protein